MGSLAQKRYVARGVEQRVQDDVEKTLVAVEGDRGGAKGRGCRAPQRARRGDRGESEGRLELHVRWVRQEGGVARLG
eukprot:5370029-Pleurochrysis_carterae.AAC.1